ncbi:MAG: hypothetical protein AAFN91_17790 [Pseudomonadota bacterium]
MRICLTLLVFSVLSMVSSAQTAEDRGYIGSVTEVPLIRPPLEPDRVFAGNDTFVLDSLRSFHARGDEEDQAVLSEMETYGLKKIPPPLLLEYARRQWSTGIEAWDITFGIAKTRMMYDRMVCKDRSAHQFQLIVEMEFQDFTEFNEAYMARSMERQSESLRIALDSGDFFNSEASAWWICSHGSSVMWAATSGTELTLDDWWVGETARAKIKKQGEAALSAGVRE